MLRPISECGLSESDLFTVSFIKGWCALDTESGAFLFRTNGRGKHGISRYILILPNRTPEERGGLAADYEWDYPAGRKSIRAWAQADALATANERLTKMLAKKKKDAGDRASRSHQIRVEPGA